MNNEKELSSESSFLLPRILFSKKIYILKIVTYLKNLFFMEVRKATVADIEEIYHINKVIDYGNSKDFIVASILSGFVHVCVVDKQVVWFLLYQMMWWNTVFLSLIKVLPIYQRQWIWSMLLKAFEHDIKESKHTSYISSTQSDSQESRKFHAKHDLHEIGRLDMSHAKELFFKKELL